MSVIVVSSPDAQTDPGTQEFLDELWTWLRCGSPKFGGTYVYCQEVGCAYRTRISRLSRYRRHWRRTHLGEQP